MKTDTQLQHDVLAQLEWEPSIDASQIGVTAKDCVVTLTGSVYNYAAKMTAERVTKGVYGVMGVANDIVVKLPGGLERSDADIAGAALNVLRWDVAVPDERIKVMVREGWVTLDGEVEWEYQRGHAENDVRNLVGVRGVTSKIVVKSHVKSGDVKQKIEAAFSWMPAALASRRMTARSHSEETSAHGRNEMKHRKLLGRPPGSLRLPITLA